jgi:hypothetical protein
MDEYNIVTQNKFFHSLWKTLWMRGGNGIFVGKGLGKD